MSLLSTLTPVLTWVSLLLLPPGLLLILFERWRGRGSPVFFRQAWRAFHLAALAFFAAGFFSVALAPGLLEACGLATSAPHEDPSAAIGWLFGVSLVAAWWLRALHRRHRWEKASSPARDPGLLRLLEQLNAEFGLAAPPETRERTDLKGPAVSGLLRPVLWVPVGFATENVSLQRAALAHEIVHLKDRDLPWDLVQRLAFGLFFFHPLLWWSASASSRATERAADRRAVDAGTSAAGLAQALIRFASPSAPFGRAVSPGFAALRDRLLCLEQKSAKPRTARAIAALVGLSFAAPVTTASVLARPAASPSLACAIQNQSDYVHELIRHSTPEKPYSER